MRTIYLVNGRNDMMYEDLRWWNIQAFASREDAERFIVEKQEEYDDDMSRLTEIHNKWYDDTITEEEKDEYTYLEDKWKYTVERTDPKHEWYISEIQFQE